MIVRIYKPAKNAMQSGQAKTHEWILEYEPQTARTPEPLMGWIASGDTLNQVKMRFPTREGAVAFAKEKGWQFVLSKPKERVVRPRNYGDNFRFIPVKGTDARKVVHATKKPPHQTPAVDEVHP